MKIVKIVINKKSVEFLEKRLLQKQYQKSKKFILEGNFKQVNFKLREPKKDQIYYFRLNKQFRVLCRIEKDILKIFHIDNHQN